MGASQADILLWWTREATGPQAEALRAGLRGEDAVGEFGKAGAQLREGVVRGGVARRLRRELAEALRDPYTLSQAIDEFGYTPLLLRAALSEYMALSQHDLGSDGHCIVLDLQVALGKATKEARMIGQMLIAGYGPAEVGRTFGLNGSRAVAAAMVELAALLSLPPEPEEIQDEAL